MRRKGYYLPPEPQWGRRETGVMIATIVACIVIVAIGIWGCTVERFFTVDLRGAARLTQGHGDVITRNRMAATQPARSRQSSVISPQWLKTDN